ncbi:copper resistance protein B [Caulobacter sp. 17J65-9]|uniref:copper resistance protein B n=1 Tax=Caulobacter sp. 17J65-9 TaxID=2709382 RepID=UPI0013C945F0|nr:copper resistance protein B [Caulobacter sp. 17J65-9]NEX91241.1 copper resistance protein B [Caulobacter sp. 17J65-9]
MSRIAITAIGAALMSFGAASAQAETSSGPMGHHERTYTMVRMQADASEADGAGLVTWEGDAWVGGDVNKLWLKTEGEVHDGEPEKAELQALWSRNVATFWDLQAGVRQDFEPEATTWLALGVQGLAPYQFETDAAVFVSDAGDVAFRLGQSFDFQLTQRLVLEPEVELNAYAQDVPELDVGAGLSDVEAKLQLRYEITRKFAPYVAVAYERQLGETASIARTAGEDTDETTLRVGLRAWF